MTARAELFASLCLSQGMCWGDEREQFKVPILHEAPIRMPLPSLLLFPVSVGAAEPDFSYRRDCRKRMTAWVADRLTAKSYATEHEAWKIATDLAVAELGRGLHGNEQTLITSAVRDYVNVTTAAALHTPRSFFR